MDCPDNALQVSWPLCICRVSAESTMVKLSSLWREEKDSAGLEEKFPYFQPCPRAEAAQTGQNMSMGPVGCDPFGPCCWSVVTAERGQCNVTSGVVQAHLSCLGPPLLPFCPAGSCVDVSSAESCQQELCSFTEPTEHLPYHYEIITHIPPFWILLDG